MAIVNELEEETEKVYQFAESFYGRSFKRPNISLKLKGATAGKACYGYGVWEIRYNAALYRENKKAFIDRTVPHEIAHMIVRELHGSSRTVKPHGWQWKKVCRDIGMTEVTRCHSYDVTNTVNRRAKPYVYTCGCQEFNLTITLHRRISKGDRRVCRSCKGLLTFKKISII